MILKKLNKEIVAIIAVLVNIILAISKIIIGSITKSSMIFAQGLDSAVDIISSFLSFIGIMFSKKPADKKHPYGHYKYEVLSGLIISIILLITGIFVLYESYLGFLNPIILEVTFLSLGVMVFSVIANEVMSRLKIYYGKKEQSISLISDGIHSRIDVISSIVVFIGLLLSPILPYIDSILTFLIGIYVIKESVGIGREAIDSLLDSSAGDEIEGKIKTIIEKNEIKLSDLKTQKKGSMITANLLIDLPKNLNLNEANKISSSLQKQLSAEINNLGYVSIQINSHEIENDFYIPKERFLGTNLGHGVHWQNKGKFRETLDGAKAKGPGGKCICKICGYEIVHEKGIPCSTLFCPKCNVKLERS